MMEIEEWRSAKRRTRLKKKSEGHGRNHGSAGRGEPEKPRQKRPRSRPPEQQKSRYATRRRGGEKLGNSEVTDRLRDSD